MHGVGYDFIRKIFLNFGFSNLVIVREQIEPDPEFSTVKYPNPEEGEGALKLAIAAAEAAGSKIIFANDPDADRLAIAE
jgi:phosphomannomutase